MFRERGLNEVSIADITSEAALTYAFHGLFADQEALAAEALICAQ
ncbi:hypothetical protein [Methylobacterium radiodurans]|nr:hypothetical protein [Methylobacterium radiodurans]